jgi:hypothetical protein
MKYPIQAEEVDRETYIESTSCRYEVSYFPKGFFPKFFPNLKILLFLLNGY